MQRPRSGGFIVFCVLLLKHFGDVVMKSPIQKCIREGGFFFLAVGVGDACFACKSMFSVSTLSLCLIQKLLQVKML